MAVGQIRDRQDLWKIPLRHLGTVFLSRLVAVVIALFVSQASWPNAADGGEFPVSNSRDARLVRAKIQAAQFLSKATFGPTEESIDALATRINQIGIRLALSEWIDDQFEIPTTSHQETAYDLLHLDGTDPEQDGIGISLYRYQVWWHIALTSPDQLKQRLGHALSQIFVIGDSGEGFNNQTGRDIGNGERSIPDWVGMANFHDMLIAGTQSTYRELLEEVTYHPCMGVWLSSIRNRKANLSQGRYPDENYAREIMQLFSIGLYEMYQDGRLKVNDNGELIATYDNYQIKELARLFTGFRYAHNTSTSFYSGRNLGQAMTIYPPEHDTNYNYSDESNAPPTKTVFNTVLPPLASPITEQAVRDEIGAGLDAIANHENVAPFICRRLIQRLVKSNPSRGYMRRVTKVFNNNGQGVRGDLKAVVKAILTDPELFRGQRVMRRRSPARLDVITSGTEHSRLREPIIRVTSMIRALRPSSDYADGYMMLNRFIEDDLGQMAFRSPTVFNFYLPDYQPPGDLVGYSPSRRIPTDVVYAPEFQILNGVTANRTLNVLRRFCLNRYVQYSMRKGTCRISFDLEPEMELARNLDNLDQLLRHYDLLLCNGSLSETTKSHIKDAIIAETTGRDYNNKERLESLLHALVVSPDCAIEE
ncbi:DUF1800 domain-containing protein [Stieleria sp. JC731]|uniref:DUF1800 family protein n=1 Tax=Pirellulaceae TaxID=2691357 RepID=UPI001E28C8E0|nr:DUF1800 family protein [Stieleria sp. JC731]MCC9600684.1 DUF1800 domain-containing protein [Stieleria sp. JC731]